MNCDFEHSHSPRAIQQFEERFARHKEAVLFVPLLASVILLSPFASSQALSPVEPSTHSDLQQKTSDRVDTTSEPISTSGIPTASSSAARIERIGHGVSAPVPIKTPQAKYTREARKMQIEGTCVASIIVDPNGIPQNAKVVRSIGYGLDEAALAAIKKYRFKPAMKNGHPVAVQIMIEVNFKLY